MMRAERGAGETLLISHRFDFTTSRGPILIAATTSPKHAATLSAACPQLLDATALPRSTPFSEAVKAYGDRLECYVERQQGSLKKVDFRTVLPGELTRYISPPVKIALADIALFVADVSQESSERVRLSVHTRWSQALSEHFIYWFADRPMFLRTLTVDVRAVLEPEREVHVQEFLGGVGSLMRDAGDSAARFPPQQRHSMPRQHPRPHVQIPQLVRPQPLRRLGAGPEGERHYAELVAGGVVDGEFGGVEAYGVHIGRVGRLPVGEPVIGAL
jgi:hypothetical protein